MRRALHAAARTIVPARDDPDGPLAGLMESDHRAWPLLIAAVLLAAVVAGVPRTLQSTEKWTNRR